MTPILLVGAGGHARSCADVIESTGKYSVYGLVGLPGEFGIIGVDEDLPRLREKCSHALVTVGQIKSPAIRIKLFEKLMALEFELPVLIASSAYVSPRAEIGHGSIVMHGAIVNAGAQIGVNCIMNSRSLIEHDALIENHCHISTGAIVNGGTRVGSCSFVGSGAILREGIEIGERLIIPMGTHVV